MTARILVASHDAGGATSLAPVVARLRARATVEVWAHPLSAPALAPVDRTVESLQPEQARQAVRGFAPDLLPSGGAASTVVDAGHAEPAWLTDEDAAFARAARDGMPLVMDFWAEWCAACIELDHQTWNQAEVLALAERFVPVKMDMTARNDRNKARNERYGVIGMPTVIFFDSEGNELERFSGFKDARAMAAVMERVLARVQ